jgi:hypothetical protein
MLGKELYQSAYLAEGQRDGLALVVVGKERVAAHGFHTPKLGKRTHKYLVSPQSEDGGRALHAGAHDHGQVVTVLSQKVEHPPADLDHAVASVKEEVYALAFADCVELIIKLGDGVVRDHGVIVQHVSYHR